MPDWMKSLSDHYAAARRRSPDDDLLIVFDIDGTIVDMRHLVCYLLLAYDGEHGTTHFTGLVAEDVDVHENDIMPLLSQRGIDPATAKKIVDWFEERKWSRQAILASHRSFPGVMDVIRWFQIQPRTHIALNTGRPETMRRDTLDSLNALGSEYHVTFDNALLWMAPSAGEEFIPGYKAAALSHFRDRGYRVFAMIDNEPENIETMIAVDEDNEILFLHAETIFNSVPNPTPRTVRGDIYDITNLLSESDLPDRVQLVWHGVNDQENLRQFLASPVAWGEIDVRRDPAGRIILRHDGFDENPWTEDDRFLSLDDFLFAADKAGKSIKVDIKENGSVLESVLERIGHFRIENSRLWITCNMEDMREEGFRKVAAAHPGAVLQTSIDFLGPVILTLPDKAHELCELFRGWGLNRLSLGWQTKGKRRILKQLQEWGWDVDVHGIPDLETFLQAVLLLPTSVTADFNFPAWNYYGRGSGQDGQYHRYPRH
jgi:hypothetical protein